MPCGSVLGFEFVVGLWCTRQKLMGGAMGKDLQIWEGSKLNGQRSKQSSTEQETKAARVFPRRLYIVSGLIKAPSSRQVGRLEAVLSTAIHAVNQQYH